MPGRFKTCSLAVGISLLAGCADFATPVTVLAPKPEHEGTEPPLVGVACAYKILWVFSFGDSRIGKAKTEGGVADVATVEVIYKTLLVDTFPLNFYKRQCTEVAGYGPDPA